MEGTKKKKFTWSEDQTIQFIRLRMEKDAHFTGHRNASVQGFALVLKEMGLDKEVTPAQASKKWENLKKKYRDLILPRTGSGTECGESTPATWPYFDGMHKAMGDKDSIKPLNPIATAVDSDVAEELDEAVGTSATSGSTADHRPNSSAGPSTSPDPLPGCSRPKRSNAVLEYLKEYDERQEKRQRELDSREEEREKKREQQLDTLIGIFGKLVEKHK